ncbi:hypothetical protein [Sporosarcina newyorkensis]|uniref:Uncharacterized protein n=1 Tax=Sporosarcina newyorkensis TaxID=759851 RepID=A0A1T4YT70_9BACL|nr:hypothetical protein [Sporosarcina newyorkensis]SKB04989.1 hypothetical protein SAMN04244570_3513 [Sporosarcina newyorkensis]
MSENQSQEEQRERNERIGCGALLFVIIIGFIIYSLATSESDSYDPNDWNFDGKVDYDDAEMKLDWIIENE